jgi:hypothetical protein
LPATVTASITATLYNAPGCTGTTTAKSAPGTIGVGSSESLRLDAAATGTPSALFDSWSVESGTSFTVIAGTSGRSICVAGFSSGSKFANANYTTVTTRTTTTTVTSSANPSTYGDSVTFTAAVTATGGNPSGVGTVTFKRGTDVLCANVALTLNSATCAISTLSATASPHSITAEYSGGTSGATVFSASTSAALSQVVNKRLVTVTADANSKTYGAADPVLSYQITSGSLVTGDSFSGSLTRVAGETVAGSPYAIQQGTLTAGGNYNLTFVGANFTINKKTASVTPDAKN